MSILNAILKIFRIILLFIDGIVYNFLIAVYNLMDALARTTLFTTADGGIMSDLGDRIYSILGVIMIFKLAFSIITYIVNPDKMEKGMSTLIKNIVVVVVLIVVTPFIFTKAMQLQRIVINEDIIGRMIIGINGQDKEKKENEITPGQEIAFDILSTFIRPNEKRLTSCEGIFNYQVDGTEKLNACVDELKQESGETPGGLYQTAVRDYDIDSLLDPDLVNAETSTGDHFIMKYSALISTIAGGFATYIFLIFCIDIAVRSVTLSFLQLVAPIPIVSRIDENSKLFKNWLDKCKSTYLDLFIRLAAVYFAIFIIRALGTNSVLTMESDGEYSYPSFMVMIFIIFGSLLFAKQLPQLLKDLLGTKGGNFNLGLRKRLAETPLIGGAASAGLTAAGSAALAAGRMGTGAISSAALAVRGKKDEAAEKLSSSAALASARLKAGRTTAWNNLKAAGVSGTGKFDGLKKDYDALIRGDKAGLNSLGDKLYSEFGQYVKQHDKDYEEKYKGVIKDSTMAATAGLVDQAKDRKNALQSYYEKMKMELERGNTNVSSADVDKARVASVKAESDYDKVKTDFSRQRQLHQKDAERYDAFNRAKDAADARSNVSAFESVPDIPTSQRREAQQQAQQQAQPQRNPQSIQDRINQVFNVHDPISSEDHDDVQAYYDDLFSQPSNSDYLDRVEQEIDRRNANNNSNSGSSGSSRSNGGNNNNNGGNNNNNGGNNNNNGGNNNNNH